MVTKKTIKKIKEPMLREISFSGNMPSPYEKDLKKALAKSAAKSAMKRRKK